MDWFWYAVSLMLISILGLLVVTVCVLITWWDATQPAKEPKSNLKFSGLTKADLMQSTAAAQRYDKHMAKLRAQNMHVSYRSK